MWKQVKCILFDHYENKDYSQENQKKALQLAMHILHISRLTRREGLTVLSDLETGYPVLDRGLCLVLRGVEPEIVESVLLNTMLTNQMDLLTGLLIIEGVKDIQSGLNPGIIKDLLKSYFTFSFEDAFEQECEKRGYNDEKSGILSQQEISRLLHKQPESGEISGMLSQQEISQLLHKQPGTADKHER